MRAGAAAVLAIALGCGGEGRATVDVTSEPMIVTAYAVAWDGEAFVVVWGGLVEDSTEHRLWGTRISDAGDVVTAPTQLAMLAEPVGTLSLLPLGGQVVIADRPTTTNKIRGRILQASTMVAGAPVDLGNGIGIGLAAAGDRIAVSWCNSGTHVRFSDASFGAATTTMVDVIGNEAPNLIAGADVLYAVWLGADRVRLATLDPAGTVVTPGTVLHDLGRQADPHAVRLADGDLLVSWLEPSFTSRAFWRGGGDGTSRWAAPVKLVPDNRVHSMDLAIGVRGSRVLLAWQDDRSSGVPGISGAFVDDTGVAIDEPFVITDGSLPARDPKIAASERRFGVLSVERGDGRYILRLDLVE